MTIFITNLKRIFKRRLNRVIIFGAPIVFVIIAFYLGTNGISVNVGIVDKDNTEFTQSFIKGLQGKSDVEIVNEDIMKTSIMNKSLAYGIVIDKGFTEDMLNGKDVKLKTYRADEVNIASSVKLYIEDYISAAKNISNSTKGNKELFYSSMKDYEKGKFSTEKIIIGDNGGDGQKEKIALGLLGYTMLLLATFSTNLILEDKKNNTYIRMFASPLKNLSYMMQNILSFLFVLLVQISVTFQFMTRVYKVQLGASEINMYLIFALYAATCVALSLAIGSISRNVKQAATLGMVATTLIGMLGGLFWPKEYMPDVLLTIGKFTPAYWLTDGIDKLLTSSSITSVAMELGVLSLFTIVFFMISSWGKVYSENV